MGAFSWGVDGFGVKHYLCDYCELVFGPVNPEEIKHECDRSKPRYHDRDNHYKSLERQASEAVF